jgi:hypothetical protein
MKYLPILLLLLSACTKQPKLDGIDLVKWKADFGGCKGDRLLMRDRLKELKEELKGTSAADMAQILGNPDLDQLADRNQKYYVYFLESGEHCLNIKQKSQARSMAIRFSAIGLATEVTFQKGTP